MDQYLRKYQWLMQFAILAIAASLAAIIVNRALVSAQLARWTVPKLPTYTVSSAGGEGGGASSIPDASRWDDTLRSRCLFGCVEKEEPDPNKCPDGCDEGERCESGKCVPVEEEEQEPARPDVPVESDLNVKLEGCMVAANPKYSTAMVRNGETEETYVVGPGDYLPEDSKVVRIARDRIFIRRDGQLEFIRLEETIGGDPSPVSVSPPGNSGSGSSSGAARRAAKALRQSGQGSGGLVRDRSGEKFELSEEKVRNKLDDRRELAHGARTTANYEEGEKKGVKMVGVSPDSIYSKLGFQTGDVLHSVGGQKIDSGTDLQALIDQFRSRDSVSVTVERNGELQEREYHLE